MRIYAKNCRPVKKPLQSLGSLTKVLLIMKLTVFFLLVGLLNANAKGHSQTVTFSGKNVTLAKVLNAVEKQTGYTFFANKGLLKGTKTITLSVKDMSLTEFLDITFKDQPVDYEINNKTIFIKEKATIPSTAAITGPSPSVPKDPPLDITGSVRGADGMTLAGATITVKGTRNSVVTNADGQFSISAEANDVLVISYIGHQTQELPVNGRTTFAITLQKVISEIEQVVVTALGITRRTRTLTYNVQEVSGDEVNRVRDANFVNSLQGKVAGATINSSSAGTGGSARVVLRGVKSIRHNNNALYVIDGIPMPTNTTNTTGQADDIFSGAGQTGDFVSNINPEDIESVSVLSGPSAAALYGSTAANGVILITTKRGQKNRTDVSVSNYTTFSSPMILPEFQNTYGPSEVGSYYSWGEKLSTPSSYNPEDFFKTGVNATSSVTLSTGNEKSQTYISFGNVTARGIVPNNKFGRSNVTLRNTNSLLDGRMTLDISFMGGLVNEQNMISQGQYFNPLAAVYLFPPGDDFNRVKAYERYNASRNLMDQWWEYGDNGLMMQNPYWVTQRDIFQNKKERYMTTLSLKYNINNWINLTGRVKMDKNNEKAEKKFAAGTNTFFASQFGYYSLNTIDNRQIYADAIANITKNINNDISLNANVGTAIEDVVGNQYLYGGDLKSIANLFTFANINTVDLDAIQTGSHKQKQSVFGSVQLGHRNMVFLDLTARNDWASTLAGAIDKSFFYFSTGLSAVITDLLPQIRSSKLTYLKLRASYSEVGNEPMQGLTNPTYRVVNGLPVTQKRMPNPEMRPELTKSLELGINAAFFDGALRIDATAYASRTYDQTFEPTLSSSSGFTSVFVNAGRIDNKGVEINARYSRKFGAVSWSTYGTYSLNRNKIIELLPGWTNPVTGEVHSISELNMSGTGSYRITLTEGGTMGDVYVNTLRVDEHGAIYVDPGSQTVIPEPNRFVYAGSSMPRYNASWGNTVSWKGISLNALVTARVGGIVVSNTQAIMDAFGVSKATADARDAGGAIVNGRPIPAREYYQAVGAGASGGIASMYTYSATNVRLGEVSLGYDLPVKKWVKFIKSANVSVIGRNLFFFYNSAPFDPELTANTQTFFQGIDYFMMPSLRSVGVSVKLNF